MVYAFTYEVPVTDEVYREIALGIGDSPAPGFIAHIAHRTATGLCYLDVWESEDDFAAFERERLHPVVHKVLGERLGFVPPEPPRTVLDVVHVWSEQANRTG